MIFSSSAPEKDFDYFYVIPHAFHVSKSTIKKECPHDAVMGKHKFHEDELWVKLVEYNEAIKIKTPHYVFTCHKYFMLLLFHPPNFIHKFVTIDELFFLDEGNKFN